MFTSRAEYRLLFNHSSSEIRYLSKIKECQLLSKSRISAIEKKQELIDSYINLFQTQRTPNGKTIADELKRGNEDNVLPEKFLDLHDDIKNEIIYQVKYEGYLVRELKNIEKLKDAEKIKIPHDFVYTGISGLRKESAEKLSQVKPETLAQANRISGVNPSDINVLMVLITKRN